MPRHKKPRYTRRFEGPSVFKPAGEPFSQLEAVNLQLDELEAMRLCDKEGLDQTEAAERMKISRGTLQRLLYSGREKVVDALVNAKGLTIEGAPHIRERGRGRGRRRRGRNKNLR